MELTKALAAIANQLKEQGADHGIIINLQEQIAGIDQEIDDKIKEALAGYQAPSPDLTAVNQAIADLQTRVTALEQGVEDAEGDPDEQPAPQSPPPPPAPVALAVSPSTLSLTVGAAVTQSLSVSGGTAPYSFSSTLADLSVDAGGNVTGTPAAAETGTITVTDSSSPVQTETVAVTVS